jgi:hypothetical protein
MIVIKGVDRSWGEGGVGRRLVVVVDEPEEGLGALGRGDVVRSGDEEIEEGEGGWEMLREELAKEVRENK